MTIGVNVDPNHPGAGPSADILKQSGFEGVRLTAKPDAINVQYIADMLAAGLTVVGVVGTGDNQDFVPPDPRVILQIYNEPDAATGTTITAIEYADLFATWSNKPEIRDNSSVQRWTAGFASGVYMYYLDFLEALRSRHPEVPMPDAVAIHPYEQDPDGLRRMAENYWLVGRAVTGAGIPVVATEWFQSVNPDLTAADDVIDPFQHALNDPDPQGVCTVWSSFFAWHDDQSDLPGGITNHAGVCLPEGIRLIAAIGGDSSWCG
ncbi:MAG TPA: hypothetical protein VKV73_20035 [Chloroflexota bacterium]|nr:hypothetical protein [Chloroflexota bacterium]